MTVWDLASHLLVRGQYNWWFWGGVTAQRFQIWVDFSNKRFVSFDFRKVNDMGGNEFWTNWKICGRSRVSSSVLIKELPAFSRRVVEVYIRHGVEPLWSSSVFLEKFFTILIPARDKFSRKLPGMHFLTKSFELEDVNLICPLCFQWIFRLA